MAITLPPLPYADDALAPAISATTLQTHHGKHHKAYVDKTNAAIDGTDLAGASLEQIIAAADAKGDKGLFKQGGTSIVIHAGAPTRRRQRVSLPPRSTRHSVRWTS